MASRIVIGGRSIGSGKYGGDPKCLCGQSAQVLGRCLACHEALRRKRQGLPPVNDAEGKRLAGFLEKHKTEAGRCKSCGEAGDYPHKPGCVWEE